MLSMFEKSNLPMFLFSFKKDNLDSLYFYEISQGSHSYKSGHPTVVNMHDRNNTLASNVSYNFRKPANEDDPKDTGNLYYH